MSGKFFASWHKLEIVWLFFCPLLIFALSLCLKDSPAGIAAAVTGVIYTLLAGKGKIVCFAFGIVNVLLYSYVSFRNKLYGEVMLNICWYLPMMFVGFCQWRKHLDHQEIIHKTFLHWTKRMIFAAASLAGITAYSLVLKNLGDSQPWIDSTTTVLSVIAMIMTVYRCIEQWILWMIVNALSVYMWIVALLSGAGSVALLIMWTIFFVNSFVFFWQWCREIRRQKENMHTEDL